MAQARRLHRVAQRRAHGAGVADREPGQQGSAVSGQAGCRVPEVAPHRVGRGQQRRRRARPLGDPRTNTRNATSSPGSAACNVPVTRSRLPICADRMRVVTLRPEQRDGRREPDRRAGDPAPTRAVAGIRPSTGAARDRHDELDHSARVRRFVQHGRRAHAGLARRPR